MVELIVARRRYDVSRFVLITAISVLTALATLVPPAEARTTAVKGLIIASSRPVGGQTGDCLCEWQWYTVGLNPGKILITANMGEPSHTLAPIWSMRLVVLKGSSAVASADATCTRSFKLCRASAKVNLRVRSRGVYYIRVEGRAANLIPYGLVVRGSIYKIR
jgi:hypothetical protein